jgi:hypothetical protein
MPRVPLLLLLVAAACSNDKDPEDVPFKGWELGDTGGAQKKTEDPPPDPDAGASAWVPVPNTSKVISTGRLSSCCSALRAAARSTSDKGARQMNERAAQVCDSKLADVRAGKTTEAKALSEVRLSLLRDAPGACR